MESESEQIFITSNGEQVFRSPGAILIPLKPGHSVLSTSYVNGGYREDLTAVYNHQPSPNAHCSHELEGGSIPAYMALTAQRLGIDPETSAGLMTAARMKNAAIISHSFRGVEVTAIITAGVVVNGGRAGDPASYYQEDEKFQKIGGTINIILIIGANIPENSMIRGVITAVEAKTAALQQLMAPSRYSSGIATGSGTDQIVIISDRNSKFRLTDTGKHSKLGELIGISVLEGTTQALDRQSAMNNISQRDVMVRLDRFSISEEDIWTASCKLMGENRKTALISSLREISKEPALVAAVASIIHIHDEVGWGLLPDSAARNGAIQLLLSIPGVLGIIRDDELDVKLNREESVLDNLTLTLAWIAKRRIIEV